MKTIKCDICGKTFDSARRLMGHLKVHKPGYEEQKHKAAENARAKSLAKYEKEKAEYELNPRRCLVCNSIIDFERAIKKHVKCCSPSCVVKWGNTLRNGRSESAKIKIAESLKNYWASDEGKKVIQQRIIIRKCQWCGKEFRKKAGRHSANKYCSAECASSARSKKRINKIIKDGSSNFSSKWILNYNNNEYRCDSLLEAAAVIWLIDNMGASEVNRCTDILEYIDSKNIIHRYNPDFLSKIGDDTYIIEVKQNWEAVSNGEDWHRYSLYWEEKKEALNEYAKENGFKALWLNPTYDAEFKKLYRKILMNKNSYNLTKISKPKIREDSLISSH